MNFLDFSIIAIYFGIILWIAKWASEKKEGGTFSSADYLFHS